MSLVDNKGDTCTDQSSGSSREIEMNEIEEEELVDTISPLQQGSRRTNSKGISSSTTMKAWPEVEKKTSIDTSTSTTMPSSLNRRSCLQHLRHSLFYSYMSPILKRGAALHKQRKQTHVGDIELQSDNDTTNMIGELSKDDCYAVPATMEAQYLADIFWKVQKEQQQQAAAQQQESTTTTTSNNNRRNKSKTNSTTKSFLQILWIIAKPTYLQAALWQFIVVICQCSLPLLVREVLLRLEDNPGQNFNKEGLTLAFCIFIISLIEGVSNERQKFLSFRTGITLRSAVVSAAHGHVLSMTPRGRSGLTSGEITNLVAVDAQKLFELTQEGHYSWSCPLAMVIVGILLVLELGVASLVGITTMFLIVPFVHWVVKKMMYIRKLRVKSADKRVESTSAMLQGIRFTKLNCYEGRFIERIMNLRRLEVQYLHKELFFLSLTIFATVTSPVIASGLTFVVYTLMDESNVITASMTFTSLFLFAALRFPINYAGKFMGKAAQGFQACHRFSLFFARDSLDDWIAGSSEDDSGNGSTVLLEENGESSISNGSSEDTDRLKPLVDINASFCVGDPRTPNSFTLSTINMTVHRSEIMCVVGPVAAGKSTLVQGLIGELTPMNEDDRFRVSGKISFASQIPFILNATVRDNILFGEPYDKDRYGRVLEACCLTADIETFHYKDLTEIGERGVTLSGGQKARMSLARVAYSQPDVAILDDVLSALDAGTGKKVFEKLFKPPGGNGLFSNTAVVLVTHASHFLNLVDSILVLVNGKSVFVGEWDELEQCHPSDPNEMDAIEAIRSSVQEDHSNEGDEQQQVDSSLADVQLAPIKATTAKSSKVSDIDRSIKPRDQIIPKDEDGKIMTVEERKFGLSQMSTWLAWFHWAGGPFFFAVIIVSMAIDRGMYVATEWWLAIWTQGAYEPVYQFGREYAAQSSGMDAQYDYIKTYLIILLISCVSTIIRTNWIIQGGARGASRLFAVMLNKVLYAPMSYFDTTPIGRLMNRFTYDTETLDVTLVMNMTVLMTSLGWIFTGIILQSIILPWQLVVILIITVGYWVLVLHYRKSAVDLQRLDATSRSPVQAQLGEAIDGTSTMRVFGKSAYFSNVFRISLDENSGMMMNFMAAHRWLAVRIQMLGACSVLFSVAFVACFNDVLNLDPGIAAMLIIWSANFTISLSFFVQGISESEASMTSLERVLAMIDIPQEEDKSHKPESVDDSWPSRGDLTFDKVDLRYRPGLPLSLNSLSFSLKSGQRCGVVGRTGAGKSTLAAALFRLVELEGGSIIFDGQDISRISLQDVRGRPNGMTIIPQEPVLLPGTLKQCLDPFGDYTDKEVTEALLSVRGASRGLGDINEVVEEGGRNFSVGERQLICLGRAMLAKPRLLFLDEATASVDGETDAQIQRMLRSRFDGTTLLTIAHRLNTIMDYDVILVVDEGRAAEFGTPAELLSNEEGIFSQLVDATGKESSVALRSMVFNE